MIFIFYLFFTSHTPFCFRLFTFPVDPTYTYISCSFRFVCIIISNKEGIARSSCIITKGIVREIVSRLKCIYLFDVILLFRPFYYSFWFDTRKMLYIFFAALILTLFLHKNRFFILAQFLRFIDIQQ